LFKAGRHAEAATVLEEVVGHRRTVLPRHHPNTIASIELLGECYEGLVRAVDAAAAFQEAYDARRQRGESIVRRVILAERLISAHRSAGRLEAAESVARIHHAESRAEFGAAADATARSVLLLGEILVAQSRTLEADSLLATAIQEFDESGSDDADMRHRLVAALDSMREGKTQQGEGSGGGG